MIVSDNMPEHSHQTEDRNTPNCGSSLQSSQNL